jgi:hypothetical protein
MTVPGPSLRTIHGTVRDWQRWEGQTRDSDYIETVNSTKQINLFLWESVGLGSQQGPR